MSTPQNTQELKYAVKIHQISSIQKVGDTRAAASITIGDAFAVHGVKIVNGKNGLFVSMPSIRLYDGSFRDTFHAITAEARRDINDAVFSAYDKECDKLEGFKRAPSPEKSTQETPESALEDAPDEELEMVP